MKLGVQVTSARYLVPDKSPSLVKHWENTNACIFFEVKFCIAGGFVEDRMLSKDELGRASKLPAKEHLQGELLTVVESAPSNTSQLLGHHIQNLSVNLEQFIKDQTTPVATQEPTEKVNW